VCVASTIDSLDYTTGTASLSKALAGTTGTVITVRYRYPRTNEVKFIGPWLYLTSFYVITVSVTLASSFMPTVLQQEDSHERAPHTVHQRWCNKLLVTMQCKMNFYFKVVVELIFFMRQGINCLQLS
jgi:hypothetical protein